MNKQDFINLHMNLIIHNPKSVIINPLPSDTDPTQDIPVKMIEVTAAGVPVNVKNMTQQGIFNNLKPEQFTSIERRYTDKFDVFSELQVEVGKVSAKKDITTNFKPSKKQKKHEEE